MRHPAHTYHQLSVQGASPLELVVMLYDGAITALLRATSAIEARDIEMKCQHLNRALAIVIQLEETLDFELGGEVARNLQSFYTHARVQITKANVENSADFLRALIEHLTALRGAWREGERRLTIRGSSAQAGRLSINY